MQTFWRCPMPDETPVEKFKNELKAVFTRWYEESDLDDVEMGDAAIEVVEQFCDVTIGFDSDIDLEDDE